MKKYPDINNIDSIVETIMNIEVLGGYSRSFTCDMETGEYNPDRFIERFEDYFSRYEIKSALENVYNRTHKVNGLNGVIVEQYSDKITIKYDDGTEKTFRSA
jgi:hypothetical protein